MNHSQLFLFFSDRQDSYSDLLAKYKKIKGLCHDKDTLLESIRTTMNEIEKQMFTIMFFNPISQSSIRMLSKEQGTFLWHQLLLHVLQDIPDHGDERKTILHKLKVYYQDNREELQNIEIFRVGYRSDEAIQWYTRQCFLYKIINKIFRDDNIELIYLFRFFIIDLWNQLKNEKSKF